VRLHPVADPLEDARWDVLFEEVHASGLADLVADGTAEKGAESAAPTRRKRLVCWAARTTIMMSVMPGWAADEEESTMETSRTPMSPKESRRWSSGWRGDGGGRQNGSEGFGDGVGGGNRGCCGEHHGGMTRI